MNPIKNIAEDIAFEKWNKFTSSFDGTVPYSFNLSLFYFFKEHFQWRVYYILLYYSKDIVGLFPLVNTAKAWVSIPHFSYGGLLLKEDFKTPNLHTLIDSLISLIKNNNLSSGFYEVDIVKLENKIKTKNEKLFIRSMGNSGSEGFKETEKLTSLIELPIKEDEFFDLLSQNLKRKINKSKRSGVIIKQGSLELLDDFYDIYSKNIHHLKSLNYGKSFFKDLMLSYKYGEVKIFMAYKDSEIVGGGMLASYNGFYENMFFATAAEARKDYVSDLLHWEMISYSIIDSRKHKHTNPIYSFGRSTKGSGVHKYKSHWPVKDFPLFNYTNINDARNSKMMAKLWALLPYAVSKSLGAILIKHIY